MPATSRMKFIVTKVNDWESLNVDTKIPILFALGVLVSPPCEMKVRKLNKQHIRETGYY